MRPLTPDLARWLTTDEAQGALMDLAAQELSERALVPLLAALRPHWGEARAVALLDQALLRARAVEKFGSAAARMLFTDEALQQASGQPIARYRATRFAPFSAVADLGCGIGGDALALSARTRTLQALELDPVRATLAAHNLRVAGGAAAWEVVEADWTQYAFRSEVEAAFADPARRVGTRRVFSLQGMEPPISAILAVQERLPNLGVKVMAGVPDEELPEGCETEWIGEGGTCKEAVLWFGALRGGARRVATVILPDGCTHTLTSNAPAPPVAVTSPREWIWEPAGCVVRATLVAGLAHRLGATQLDAQIAYLTSDTSGETPFARAWPVLWHAPFNLKVLNRQLRAMGANVVAVKKRGSPLEPEAFRQRLHSDPCGQPVVLFVTRHADKPWMLLAGATGHGA